MRVAIEPTDARSDEESIDLAEEEAQIDAHRSMLENTNAWFFEELKRKQAETLKKRLADREKQAVKPTREQPKESAPETE